MLTSVADMPDLRCVPRRLVWQPRRAADTSTIRRYGFLSRRTASMEHAADTAEAAAVDHYFSSSTENISIPVSVYGRRDIAWWLFGDAPSVSQ